MSSEFQPVSGKLGQLIFESPDAGIDPRLEFFIEIEFAEMELDDEDVKPFFRASSIVIPDAKSWQALANSRHEFPWAPKPGSVDASMLAFATQNPADVIAVGFGPIEGGRVPVSFATEVDFEIEADRDEVGQVEIQLSGFPLEIAPLKIATSLEKRFNGDPESINAAIAEVVDLSAYGSVTKVPGGFELPLAWLF